MGEARHRFVIALGSNVRHPRFGLPRSVLGAVIEQIESLGAICAVSKVIESAPLGPSLRRYANAALVLETVAGPEELLASLKSIERRFGSRRGQRWSSRVLDLDIVLWSGGIWASPALKIPHPSFRIRDFVLGPAASVAPQWHDPLTSLSVRHLNARLTKPRPTTSGRHR